MTGARDQRIQGREMPWNQLKGKRREREDMRPPSVVSEDGVCNKMNGFSI